MNKRQAKLKRLKKLIIVNIASISLVGSILLGSLACERKNKQPSSTLEPETTKEVETIEVIDNRIDITNDVNMYRGLNLEQLRNVKLPTYIDTFHENGEINRYNFVEQQDVLSLSYGFSEELELYFKSCGASNWTKEDNQQFWPEDIEYIVTAIAFRESSYRTNVMNKIGCGGLMGINKTKLLTTLQDSWLQPHIWGKTIPQINCNYNEVDIFNPTTSIEYTYYNIGYNLANRFKKDKHFIYNGESRCIWDTLEYSEDVQTRLVIASHLYGLTNVVKATFGDKVNDEGRKIHINEYIYSDYVEDVLDKCNELKNTYKVCNVDELSK